MLTKNQDEYMKNFFEILLFIFNKYKIETVLIVLSLIIALSSVLIFITANYSPELTEEPSYDDFRQKTIQKIMVEVSGAAEKPGVYELATGSRLKDAVEKAGGLSQQADQAFFARNFNLAQFLNDQEKIYIPSYFETQFGLFADSPQTFWAVKGESLASPVPTQEYSSNINVNSASLDELDTLPGVGQVTTQKIVDNRPYLSIEELLTKKILKKNIYENVKDMLTIN